jgi:uncharacterized RDD family membrane protein YckC
MDGSDVLGRRVAAAVIDAFVVLILFVVATKALGKGDESRSLLAESKGGGARPVFFLLTFAYFFGMELIWAQTIGKRVMKLRVARQDGGKLTAGPAAMRNLVRFVDAFPFLYIVGAITIFTAGNRRYRLGDMAAKTAVVADDTPPPPPPEQRDRPDDDDVLAQVLGR